MEKTTNDTHPLIAWIFAGVIFTGQCEKGGVLLSWQLGILPQIIFWNLQLEEFQIFSWAATHSMNVEACHFEVGNVFVT